MVGAMVSPTEFLNPCPSQAGGSAGVVFTQLIQTLLAAHCNISNPNDYPKDYGDELRDNEGFDFIVVGAGSTGSVIASRLSENPSWRVLLVEAGGDPKFISEIPSFLFSNQGTEMDWKYSSTKSDTSCKGMVEQRCPYPRGKVMGGSSSINAMMYVRGNAEDFNEWESLGNKGWNYENVLKYFKKSENINGYSIMENEDFENLKFSKFSLNTTHEPSLRGKILSSKYHSQCGPLKVSPFADGGVSSLKEVIYDAFEEVGIPARIDVNGESQIGVTTIPGTLVHGRRANAAKMFLNEVKDRSNLLVVKNAMVRKLLIDNNNNVVEGVEFVRKDEVKKVHAKKEVIVSAGAINSPQLLMLSGIGPQDHLEYVGIKPVLNLKGVGRNLQDHYSFLGIPVAIRKSKPKQLNQIEVLDAMYNFLTKRPGLFSSIGLTDLTAFVNTNHTDLPDVQYVFINFAKDDSHLLPEVLRAFHFTQNIKRQYLDFVKDSEVVLFVPTLLKPRGRGRILLKRDDVTGSPIIQANILSHPDDIDTLFKGIKFARDVVNTSSFATLKPDILFFDIDECNGLNNDARWKCSMKYLTTSLYHPVGTCKMGLKTNPFAVVDNRLRVHGMKNLRVADASVMPTIVRGNINAACIMIGEMASDMIKQDWES